MVGIKYIAPVWDGSGYAEAARNYVLSIYRQGYPITLTPITFEKTRPDLGKDGEILRSLVNAKIDYDKIIVHSTPDLWHNFTHTEFGKYIIGYTVWETSQLHPTWVEACNKVSEIWLPSDWNLEVFKESGVYTPLYKIPHAIEVPDLDALPNFNLEGVSNDAFVFYSIFQWQERKNPYGLLASFCSAFSNVDDVILVLKTYRHNLGTDKDAVRELIMDFRKYVTLPKFPKMYLVVENMSKENIMGLHKRGDCFLLLQRSEGWGLPHFEAASVGNPVITTGYGGQTEFLKEDNSYLLDYNLSPVSGMTWSPYYTAEQYWADVDAKQAIDTMRHVYNNHDEAKDKGLKARQYIKDNFTWDIVGKKIVDRLVYLDNGGINA